MPHLFDILDAAIFLSPLLIAVLAVSRLTLSRTAH